MQPLPPESHRKVTRLLSATSGCKRNCKRLWKSEENLVDLHATEMVQALQPPTNLVIPIEARNPGVCLHHHSCLIFLVSPLKVGDLVVTLEVPDASRDLVDQIMIVRYQEYRPLIALQRDVQRIDGFKIQVIRRLIEY